ncbi:Sec-independent protein translocase protein TatB [Brevundimonas sp. Root1279]|uniref:Sec-independent protein translocase protein TatB n=1 Tax=Brevundimonas sp. Root1279 TaxID=1736443 RepID=UPI0006FE36C0|nr:Sec-independent protein translocase protein TatB [Brevundimonas sp. Root1279]KQW79782.1 hypothetical protein ASC65_14650 [Brevundimonas sp. Root1279]
MGGLGPGIGGMEYVVIAVVALLVVGPERLPAMLHKLGKMVGKARSMANEFRASFDEMARQSELDELRKEVEALRQGQSNMMPLGAEAEATFKSIAEDLNRTGTSIPLPAEPVPVDEWPDSPPVLEPLAEPAPTPKSKPRAAPKAKAKAKAKSDGESPTKTRAKTAPATPAAAKPKTTRKKAVEL